MMPRTYEIIETFEPKIVGGINGSIRRKSLCFRVVETTDGKKRLMIHTFSKPNAEQHLARLRRDWGVRPW